MRFRPSTATTLSGDRQRLLDKYEFVDLARKVVGVGSVGTRCWVALFVGRDLEDPLVPPDQGGGGTPSGSPSWVKSQYDNHGQRVVEGQRLMQGASDIFLGWDRFRGRGRRPSGLLFPPAVGLEALGPTWTHMSPEVLGIYAEICGWVLARAHARSGDAIAVGAYLGGGDRFDQADVRRSQSSYADQNERDYARLQQAVASGQVAAETGI